MSERGKGSGFAVSAQQERRHAGRVQHVGGLAAHEQASQGGMAVRPDDQEVKALGAQLTGNGFLRGALDD